jgi:glucose/arabinose dehydrogenase
MNQKSGKFEKLNPSKSFLPPVIVIIAICISFPFLFAQQPTDWIALLPEGEGKKEVTTLCSNCHSLQLIVSQRKTPDQWRNTVDDMIGRGAQLYVEEADIISTYLGTYLTPTHPSEDSSPAISLSLEKVNLPPGFKIDIYSDQVPQARSMTLSPNGTLFVGTRTDAGPSLFSGKDSPTGKVYALLDTDHDQKADQVLTIAQGLNLPNGVAFHDGNLYVAEVNRVLRFDDIENRLQNPPSAVVVNDSFPKDLHHGWKFIRMGPDGRLYIPVGAPCNICEPEDKRYASIMRMQPDGSELEVFAHGVRNTVGFDWHPKTHELWFTDNGRDRITDDIPPDELNRAPEKNLHFGYPYCHGNNISDPEFGDKQDCTKSIAPIQELGPHVASLGMRFYTGEMFPSEYRNQIFIAEHGSWNRSQPLGYRITLVRLENNQAKSYEVFAEGWLDQDDPWGRPVDVQVMPDGALLVSDDHAGAIYRISYSEN